MTIVKEDWCDAIVLEAEIKKIIPEAKVQSSLSAQIVINLPHESTNQFPDLFKELECKRTEFGVKGIGISCTTLEEVFLRYYFVYLYFFCFIILNKVLSHN